MEAMKAALTFVLKWGSLLAFTLIPIWPLLALPATVFDEGEYHQCKAAATCPLGSGSAMSEGVFYTSTDAEPLPASHNEHVC